MPELLPETSAVDLLEPVAAADHAARRGATDLHATDVHTHDQHTPASPGRAARAGALGLIVVFVTQLMLVVDASIVNVALPDIQKELHFTPSSLSWVVTGYALAFAGLMLLSGKVGTMIGAKRALMIGTIVFILASATGGLALSPEMLIASRIIQGIGAALAAPSTLVLLLANTVPGPARSRALSLFVLASGSGGAIGLILGGVLTTGFGWRWVMFVNVPIGILIVAGAAFFLTETSRAVARLDLGGAAASTVAMVGLIYGFATAASSGWTDPLVVTSFAVAVAGLITLVLIERKHVNPVVPLALFGRTVSAAPFVAMLLIPAGMFAFFYFISLFTQQVLRFDALQTGLALLPFVATMVVTSQLTPKLLPRWGEWLIGSVGLALLGLGLLWLSPLSDTSTFLNGVLGPIVVMGIGAGMTFAPITAVIMHFAPTEHTSAASSLLQTMQQLGGSIGVAALTTVFVSIAATSNETHGIQAAILGGVAFVGLAFVLFLIWGRRIPTDVGAGTTGASNEKSGSAILH